MLVAQGMGLAHEGGQLLVVLAKLSQHVVRRDIVGVIVGALDAQTKILMGYELVRLWTDHRKSVVFVTHDIEEAIGLSDRILVMTDRPGRIKSEYRVELSRPRDLRGVRKMPAFHQLSERIWRDIVAKV